MKLQGKAADHGRHHGHRPGDRRTVHAEGARVFVTGRNADNIVQARKRLPKDVTVLPADASDLGDIDALAHRIKEEAGRLDVLFVNAGIAGSCPSTPSRRLRFDEQFNVNFRGAYFTIQRLLPLMPAGSSVVLTTSIAADLGVATTSVYAATKAALSSLARTLSNELALRGIRVNEVSPGPIETPIFSKMGMSAEEAAGVKGMMQQGVPLKRLGTPEEVARAALFLASDDSTYLLGAKIRIDGGFALN